MSMKMNKWKLSGWVFGAIVAVSLLIYLWHYQSPEFARFVGYLIGGVLAVWQVVASNRRATAAEKTAESMEKGNVAERFKNAIEHLGHESVSVRLGGIYALHHIANENASYRERVFEILCAHVRETTTNKEEYKPHVIDGVDLLYPSVEIGSVLELLFRSKTGKKIYKGFEAKLMSSNLEGAYLGGANLYGIDLIKTILKNAVLDVADLNGAGLIGAKMEGASVEYANMAYAKLQGADLTGIDFKAVNLQGARFDKADCQRCNFLSAVNLTAEQLLKAFSLHEAKLPEDIKKQIEATKPELFDPPPTD